MYPTSFPRIAYACLATLTLLPVVVAAQDAIVPDRPNFVDSTQVVGRGQWQVETSVQGERDKADGVRTRTYSMPTLVRYGVGDMLELRVETDGRTVEHTRGADSLAGYSDAALGMRWHVQDAAPGRPSVGLVLQADVPSGSRAFRGQRVRPSLRLTGEWELPAGMSLGVTTGAGQERNDEGGRYGYGLAGVVLGKALTPAWGVFAEVAAPQIARGADGGTMATFDAGATWLVSNRCQLDAMLALGLNRRSPDAALTVGLSFRL